MTIAAAEEQVTEGSPATFTLSRSGDTDETLSVTVRVTETGSMLSGTPASAVTFQEGESSAMLSVATEDDAVAEDPSRVAVALVADTSTPLDYEVGNLATAVVVVVDDTARFVVSAGPAKMPEGTGGGVTVEIANGVRFSTDQRLSLSFAGTATSADYTVYDAEGTPLSSPYQATLAGGESVVAVYLEITNDAAAESEETISVSASHGMVSLGTQTVTIPDSPLRLELASLSVTGSGREMYPPFEAGTLHYGVGCTATDPVTLRLSAKDATTRVAVNGVNASNSDAVVTLEEVSEREDILIALSNAAGESTTYTVHCMASDDPSIVTERSVGSAMQLMTSAVRTGGREATQPSHAQVIDFNGVPRWHRRLETRTQTMRTNPSDKYPYSYATAVPEELARPWGSRPTYQMALLNSEFEEVTRVTTTDVIEHTDLHDFLIRDNGNFVFIAYELTSRRLDLPFYPGQTSMEDSLLEEVGEDGERVAQWNSFNHVFLRDCKDTGSGAQLRDYAHLNGMEFAADGDIIASLRSCGQVMRIDVSGNRVEWVLGLSYRDAAAWASLGVAFLEVVGDPYKHFCAQHSPRMLPNENLLLFDNGGPCRVDPATGDRLREQNRLSRVVEYEIDAAAGTARFVRQYSLHNRFNVFSENQGNVSLFDNGNWLVSWGSTRSFSNGPDVAVTEYNPTTEQELFSLTVARVTGGAPLATRAYPVKFEAVEQGAGPLAGRIVEISDFHRGPADRPTVVVAFDQPVVDIGSDTASVRVSGASSWSVVPHLETGAAANAYKFTLAPAGDGPIAFEVVAGQACSDDVQGGICTLGGARLAAALPAAVVPGPVRASFSSSSLTVTEGETVAVGVTLDPVHGRSGALEIPLLGSGTASASEDYTLAPGVAFGSDESMQSQAFTAHADSLVEGGETVELTLGPLPPGVGVGAVATTTVAIADATDDTVHFDIDRETVAEGNSVELRFGTGEGITFTTDQTIALALSGGAEPADYELTSRGVVLSAPYTLLLAAGQGEVAARMRAVDDASREDAESIVVTASRGTTSIGSRTVTVPANDRDLPQVRIEALTAEGTAEGAQLVFAVHRTGATTVGLGVAVRVSESGEALGTGQPTEVTIETGSSQASLTVSTVDDRVVEADSEVTVLVAPSALATYDIGAPQSASLTVSDNDEATLSMAVTPLRIEEGASAQITLRTLGGESFSTPQSILLELSGASADDYTVSVGSALLTAPFAATLPALANSVTLTLSAVDDADEEVEEQIAISASHDGKLIGAQAIAIAASDAPSQVSVSARSAEVGEGEPAEFVLRRRNVTEPNRLSALEVAVTVMDEGGRLTDPPPALATFDEDATEALLSLATADDSVIRVDAEEKPLDGGPVALALVEDTSLPLRYSVVAGSDTARVRVVENDRAEFKLTVSPTRVSEGGTVVVEVRSTNGVTFSESQTVTIFDRDAGDAIQGVDYRVLSPDQAERDHLRLPGDRNSVDGTIAIEDDRVAEGEETIRIVGAHDGRPFGAPLVVKVAANDGHPETQLPPGLDVLTVDGSELTLLYNRPLDVGSVPVPGDFAVTVQGVLRDVTAVRVEGAKVKLGLTSPSSHGERVTLGYVAGTNPIRDMAGRSAPGIEDRTAVEVLVSAGPDSVVEGETLTFRVLLSKPVSSDLSVSWALAGGSAVAGVDYEDGSRGTVTVVAGSAVEEIEVHTRDDSLGEPEETLRLSLSEPPGFPFWARVDVADVQGTIRDNDERSGGPGGGGSAPPENGDDEEDEEDEDEDEDDTGVGGDTGGGAPPQAAIAVDVGCFEGLCRARTGVPVRFEDASTGLVRFRRWEFGDGAGRSSRTVEHAWSTPGFYEVILWTSNGRDESTVSRVFLVEASDPAGTCVSTAGTLCLRDSRYSVAVEWWTGDGRSGAGTVAHAGTNDSGLFWFFDRANWEVLIKVLDGCALNGHVWVYGASTTTVGYSIRVMDTATGAWREYRNEPGLPAAATTDPTAFAQGCRGAAGSTVGSTPADSLVGGLAGVQPRRIESAP